MTIRTDQTHLQNLRVKTDPCFVRSRVKMVCFAAPCWLLLLFFLFFSFPLSCLFFPLPFLSLFAHCFFPVLAHSQLLWLIHPLEDEPFQNILVHGTTSCGNIVTDSHQLSNIVSGMKILLLLLDSEKSWQL